jgi:hypothetical protein
VGGCTRQCQRGYVTTVHLDNFLVIEEPLGQAHRRNARGSLLPLPTRHAGVVPCVEVDTRYKLEADVFIKLGDSDEGGEGETTGEGPGEATELCGSQCQ